jgi:iron(III) transport system substrate-binding protein
VPFAYNPQLVSPAQLTSYRDLLNPSWKGKVVMFDPRQSGQVGLAFAAYVYSRPELGKEFLKDLLSGMDVAFSRDSRQIHDWVSQGRYALTASANTLTVTELSHKGVPIDGVGADKIREGSYLTAGVATVSVFNRAPHPNALKVYLDFLMSREGQQEYSLAAGYASLRTDVPRDHIPAHQVPREGVEYVNDNSQEYVRFKDGEVRPYVESILKS